MSIEDAEELAIRIGKGTGWLLFGTLTAEIIAFFYRIMLARWLGPYEYGIFALLLMLIGFGTTFFTLGLPQALTKYISEYRAKGKATDRIFSTGLALTIFLGIMSVLSVFLLAEPLTLFVFKNPDAISSLQIGSFALFFVLLGNLFNGAIQGWQKMKYSAIGIITDKLTKFVATAILFWLGFGLLGASVALIFSFCAVALVLALLYRRLTPISISYIDYKTTKILIIFGMPVFFTSIAGYFLGWTDTLIISHFMTEEWVGYYNAALPILWILSLAIGSLATVLFSTFSELKAKKSVYIEKTINRSLKYAFYMLIPGAVGGWLLAEPIIRILFGPAYLPAASAFQILIFGALFLGLRSITDSYLTGIGKPQLIAKIMLSVAFANIVMNWFFIQWWGIAGAALSTSLSLATIFLISTWYIRKSVKLNFGYLPKTIIATVMMAFVVWGIRTSMIMNIEKIVLIIILGVGIYYAALFLLNGFDKTDKKIMKKVIEKFINVLIT